jgi:hypothetical protein
MKQGMSKQWGWRYPQLWPWLSLERSVVVSLGSCRLDRDWWFVTGFWQALLYPQLLVRSESKGSANIYVAIIFKLGATSWNDNIESGSFQGYVCTTVYTSLIYSSPRISPSVTAAPRPSEASLCLIKSCIRTWSQQGSIRVGSLEEGWLPKKKTVNSWNGCQRDSSWTVRTQVFGK